MIGPMHADVANSIAPASRMKILQVECEGTVMRGMKAFGSAAWVDTTEVHYSMPNG